MDKPVRGALKLQADFEGNADRFTLISDIKDGMAVYDNNSYPLGDYHSMPMPIKILLPWNCITKMIDLDLYSNTSPEGFGKADATALPDPDLQELGYERNCCRHHRTYSCITPCRYQTENEGQDYQFPDPQRYFPYGTQGT